MHPALKSPCQPAKAGSPSITTKFNRMRIRRNPIRIRRKEKRSRLSLMLRNQMRPPPQNPRRRLKPREKTRTSLQKPKTKK